MGVSSTEASLRAVRQDLDLSAAGSILERPVLDKANKQSGPVSLAEYKGNILGTQLSLDKGSWNGGWSALRDRTSCHHYGVYPDPAPPIDIVGREILIQMPGSSSSGDRGSEIRITGRVGESGTYRLTGKFKASLTPQLGGQLHVDLLASSSHYLSGTTDVVLSDLYEAVPGQSPGSLGPETIYDKTCTLSTSKSYVTLILRNVQKAYTDTYTYFTHHFYDFKLVKE